MTATRDPNTAEAIARLRAALEAGPTPGNWTLCRSTLDGELIGWHIAGRLYGSRDAICTADERGNARGPAEEDANAHWIAACSPDAIRTLLSKLEAAEARVVGLTGQVGVLVDVLRECDAVIATVAGEDADEDEALRRLLLTVKRVTLLRNADEDLLSATTKEV